MTAPRPEIVFHINLPDLSDWRDQTRLSFFARLATICEAHDLKVQIVNRAAELTKRQIAAPDGKLHIVEDGQVTGEGWLNAALAYLLGFWHLDPLGVLAESSAKSETYAPSSVSQDEAQVFFRGLRQRFVQARLSRYNPPRARDASLPQGSVAVFLQGELPFRAGQCDLRMHEIILAACKGAGARPVIVKPHPLSPKGCAFAIAKAADEGAVFDLFDGNIHDLLASCAVTVSANSAAAIEGFLHRKPAILFGRSDFESLVTRVHQPADFPQALHHALTTERRYAKMIHWYFTRHTLEVAAPDFEARVLDVFAKVGFGRARLGL